MKLYFRKATAQFSLKNYDEALASCKLAKNVDPDNKEIAKLVLRITKMQEALKKKQQAAYSKMFG